MNSLAVTTMLIAAVTGAADVSTIVQSIRDNNYQKVAVLPRPIVNKDADPTSVDEIAVLATEAIEQMTEALISESRGQYKVVDPDVVASAVKGLTLDDLNNPEVRRGISQKTGADVIIYVFAEENAQDGKMELFHKLVELADSTVATQGTESLDLILSDAAYMGESFEVRRWGQSGLEIVGFDTKIPRDWAMGVGPEWERIQYASLKQQEDAYLRDGQPMPHPLENQQLPYGIQLVVNGQAATPERICDKLYVPIDPASGANGQGPDIGIRMFNHSGHKVFMSVYIDGVNMINQQRELPILTPTKRHWAVRDGYDAIVRHWYHLDQGRTEQRAAFQLVDVAQSVAAGQGLPQQAENHVAYGKRIDDRLGMVTCIVYTDGWDGVDANRNPAPQRSIGSKFAFGEGDRQNTQVRWEAGERGIMLAAMTIHYRTPQELDQIRAQGCTQFVDTPSQNGTQPPATITPGPASNGTKPQIVKPTKPELPGEDAVFPKSN